MEIKRYCMVVRRDENGYASPALKVRQKGEVVKYCDVDGLIEANRWRNPENELPKKISGSLQTEYQLVSVGGLVGFGKYDTCSKMWFVVLPKKRDEWIEKIDAWKPLPKAWED